MILQSTARNVPNISNNGKRRSGNIKNRYVISIGSGTKIMCSISTLGWSAFSRLGKLLADTDALFLTSLNNEVPRSPVHAVMGTLLRLEGLLFKTLQKCWPKVPASWPMVELDEAEGWRRMEGHRRQAHATRRPQLTRCRCEIAPPLPPLLSTKN
jgi:hypothetical protein